MQDHLLRSRGKIVREEESGEQQRASVLHWNESPWPARAVSIRPDKQRP
jgi:hypothetical protein